MVRSFSINGVDSIGGAKVFFPRIAYDACSEVKIIDYYLVKEEKMVEPGDVLPCGNHLMQTFVIDSSGNYAVCEFTLEIKCDDPTKVKSSIKEKLPKDLNAINYNIGSLSRKWESSNLGPGTISSAVGDPGGKSYGIYQISSNHGYLENFLRNEASTFKHYFQGLEIGSKAFDQAWKAVARSHPRQFSSSQHDFIERTHYKVFIKRLKNQIDFKVENYSPVLKDVIWSTVVQHGPYSNILNYALAGINIEVLSEESIINLIYQERRKINNDKLVYFPRVGPTWKASLINRFNKENEMALEELKRINDE